MNLIFTSFIFNPEANKAHQIPIDVYLKNICVSLISAKVKNGGDEVSLIVTNETKKLIPINYIDLLKIYRISVQEIGFNYFVNKDKTTIWNFSFYRLSIIYELTKTNKYENICSIDSDTYTVKSFADIWDDCKSYIMLCDLNHSHEIQQAVDTYNDLSNYLNISEYITNYGGEFIASSSRLFKSFIEDCLNVFEDLSSAKINYIHGDETVISLTLRRNNYRVKNASYFCFRYWTGVKFKLLSTNIKYNAVGMYHVPDEKQYGLLSIYKYLLRHKRFPKESKCQSMLGLKIKQKSRPLVFIKRAISKLKSKH